MNKPDKFFKAAGGIGVQLAAFFAPIVMAPPTASFPGIAPASPSIPLSRPTPATPKAITAWRQPVKKGDEYSITASCYNLTGTTASGVFIHSKTHPKPVVAIPEGATHNVPFGTIVKLTRDKKDHNAVYAVVSDTGIFGVNVDENKTHPYNPGVAADIYISAAHELGFSSCKGFGKQDIIVEIVKAPPNPKSYADGKKQTEESLTELAELANTKQL
jgi:hypothetical protein